MVFGVQIAPNPRCERLTKFTKFYTVTKGFMIHIYIYILWPGTQAKVEKEERVREAREKERAREKANVPWTNHGKKLIT